MPKSTTAIMECGPYRVELLRRRRQKHLHLYVHPSGRIHLTAGYRTPIYEISRFLNAREAWLQEMLGRLELQQQDLVRWSLAPGGKVLFLGHEFEICVEPTLLPPAHRVESHGRKLMVYLPPQVHNGPLICGVGNSGRGGEQERIQGELLRFFERQGRLVLRHRVQNYSQQLGLYPRRLRFAVQRTRWGSCSATGTVSLNWGLVLAPMEIIDYVVVHELAHLKHLNHSRDFWTLVKTVCPNYKQAKLWLRTQGPLFERLLFAPTRQSTANGINVAMR